MFEDNNLIIEYLKKQVIDLQKQLCKVDLELNDLSRQRETINRSLATYQSTLDLEQGPPPLDSPPSDTDNCSSKPVQDVAELVLTVMDGLTNRELTDRIIARGKSLSKNNASVVVNSTLKRFPDKFKRLDGKWYKVRG